MSSEEYTEVEGGFIARGGFGDVRRVLRKSDGKQLACKRIDYSKHRTNEEARKQVETEVQILGRLDHPNIVRYYDVQWLTHEAKIYMEYCEDQNLDEYMAQNRSDPGWPSESDVWSVIYQLSSALMYCHHGKLRSRTAHTYQELYDNNGNAWSPVLHRDIKPLNVFIRRHGSGQTVLKLGDFGLGVIQTPEDMALMAFGGTQPYIAPEVTRSNPRWSNKADIFALGCTFYYFITRIPPFSGQLTDTYRESAQRLPARFSDPLSNLITRCIDFDHQLRPDADKIFEEALEHVNVEALPLASIITSPHTIMAPPVAVNDAPTTPPKIEGRDVSLTPKPNRPEEPNVTPTASDASNMSPSMPSNATQRSSMLQGETIVNSSQNLATPSSQLNHIVNLANTYHPPHVSGLVSPVQFTHSNMGSFEINNFGGGERNKVEEEVFEGLGSFVADYQRYPPSDSLKLDEKKRIRRNIIGTSISFTVTESARDANTKPHTSKFRRMLSRGLGIAGGELRTTSLDADHCEEFLLEDTTQYFNRAIRNGSVVEWLRHGQSEGRERRKTPTYLVVGYITYRDVRVASHVGSRGTYPGTSVSAHTVAPGINNPGISAGYSLGASSSSTTSKNSSSRVIEKRGTHIHAVTVREVDVSGKEFGDVRLKDDTVTAFFWRPHARPDT